MDERAQHYRFMFENMPNGAFFRNADGSVWDVNKAALEIFGISREEFANNTPYHPDFQIILENGTMLMPDQYPSMVALRTGEIVLNFVARLYNRPQNDYIWLNVNAIPLFREGDLCPYQVFVTLHDITLQKKAEQELVANEERYRTIVNTQLEFVNRFLPGGVLTFINDALCHYVGMPREKLLGKSFFQFIHDGDRERLVHSLESLTPINPTVETFDRVILPDGRLHWHHWTNHAIFDNAGTIVEYQSVGRDITDQKRSETAISLNDAIIKNVAEGIYLIGLEDGLIKFANHRFEEMFGYAPGELIGKSVVIVNAATDKSPEETKQAITHILKGTGEWHGEVRNIRKDGTTFWCHANVSLFDHPDHGTVIVAVHTDITKQKLTQEAILHERKLLTDIMNATDIMLVYLDPEFNFLAVNHAYAQTCRMSPQEMVSKNHFTLYPNDEVETIFRKVRDTGTPVFYRDKLFEFPDQPERGVTYWDWSLVPVTDKDGKVLGLVFSLRETTQFKKAELALIESKEKYHLLLESLIDGFALVDMQGTIREWNEAFRAMLGYSPAELPQLTYRDITPEKWHAFEDRILQEEVIFNGYSSIYEKEYIRKDGTIIPVELRTYLHRDTSDRITSMWAIARDISERKRMESNLRTSEERYRRLIATANEGIGIADSDYTIIYVNDRLAETLGYETNELIGIPVAQLLASEEQHDLTRQMQERRMGTSGRRECRHLHKDGSIVWLLTATSPIMDESGTFLGTFAMFTDLTERKAAELALQNAHDDLEQRVAERTAALARANEQIKNMTFELVQAEERERSRIAGELHDQVGQSLLLAKMKLDMLTSEIMPECHRTNTEQISTLLENSIQDIRSLTFGMRPPLLETAGMETSLEWLCTSIQRDYGLQIDFTCVSPPVVLAAEVRHSVYQAVRELLLNVVKHARTERASLNITTEDDYMVIQVEDEGAGVDRPEALLKHTYSDGFGLYNVQKRIELLGGTFSIKSSSGTGTTARIMLPITANCSEKDSL